MLQEMKELAALAYRDSLPETRDYWKNELQQAILEIQGMYDSKMDLMRTDMETSYTRKASNYIVTLFNTISIGSLPLLDVECVVLQRNCTST